MASGSLLASPVWSLATSADSNTLVMPETVHLQATLPDRDLQLTLLSSSSWQVSQNDHWIAFVSGRLRPLGEDYSSRDMANWMLGQLEQHPAEYYSQLAGFFAVVLLNRESGELRLIGDHVGSLPLNFYSQGNRWWVVRSLRLLEQQVSREQLRISPQAVYDYCFQHCVPAPRTIYDGVSRLPPGNEMRVFVDGRQQTRNLFRPHYNYSDESEAVLQDRCRRLISDAVRRNAATGAGAFLSGGLDSSTVAGMLAAVNAQTPTFSIGFDAAGYDETAFARITAQRFATRHHEHYLQPSEIIENFSEVAGYFDQPFGNSSALAAFVCAQQAKLHGVSVLLAGDGGDEIFAGNERYAKQEIFEFWARVPSTVQHLLAVVLLSPFGTLPGVRKARSYLEQAAIPLPDRLDTYNFLSRIQPADVFEPEFLCKVDTAAPQALKRARYQECHATDPLERMMYLDWKFTLADNDLVKVSTMCEKAGLEVRYPLLEKELVEFSCTIPANSKLRHGRLRDFYKKSFEGFLPDATLNKSKHGFGLPFGVWMREQPALQVLAHDALGALRLRGIFRQRFIDTVLENHKSSHAGYYGELVWVLVVLELWLRSRGL